MSVQVSFVAMFPLVFSQNRYFRPVGGHGLELGRAAAAAAEPAVRAGARQPPGCECRAPPGAAAGNGCEVPSGTFGLEIRWTVWLGLVWHLVCHMLPAESQLWFDLLIGAGRISDFK